MPNAQSPADERAITPSLEKLVDATSLALVVIALANICAEKANHIETNWQDHETANVWRKFERILDKAGDRISFLEP